MTFKQWLIGVKRPRVCQENILHAITPPAAAWTVDTRQVGSMDSIYWCLSLSLLSAEIHIHQTRVCYFVQCCLIFLFLAYRSETWWRGSSSSCSPSTSMFCLWNTLYNSTPVIMSGSYHVHSVTSSQSGHSPLISLINRCFHPHDDGRLLEVFGFSWKTSVSEILTNNDVIVKVTDITYFPDSDIWCEQ